MRRTSPVILSRSFDDASTIGIREGGDEDGAGISEEKSQVSGEFAARIQKKEEEREGSRRQHRTREVQPGVRRLSPHMQPRDGAAITGLNMKAETPRPRGDLPLFKHYKFINSHHYKTFKIIINELVRDFFFHF